MNTNEEKEREAFEAWAVRYTYVDRVGLQYLHNQADIMWRAWKAGRAALRAESEPVWINVNDRLPKAGEAVLCALIHSPNSYHLHDGFYSGREWKDGHGMPFWFKVSHWMPLPTAPQAEPKDTAGARSDE